DQTDGGLVDFSHVVLLSLSVSCRPRLPSPGRICNPGKGTLDVVTVPLCLGNRPVRRRRVSLSSDRDSHEVPGHDLQQLRRGSLSVLPSDSDQQLVMDYELPAVTVLTSGESQGRVNRELPGGPLDWVVHRLVRSVRIQVDHTA